MQTTTPTTEHHLNRLRRLRILQSLHCAYPDPMGEIALLNSVRVDQELSPTIERVRQSIRYLSTSGLAETIAVDGSNWLAARITETGKDLMLGQDDTDSWGRYEIYHPKDKPEPSSKVGQGSTVNTLPPETKTWLDQELVRRQFTGYLELESLLAEQGYEISKSALGRYGKKFKNEQKKLKQSIEMAKAFAEVVGDDHAAMNTTLTALAQQELMAVVREGRYDNNIKFPALVRAIAQLNRSEINTRKFQIEQQARREALEDAGERIRDAAIAKGFNDEDASYWRNEVLKGL